MEFDPTERFRRAEVTRIATEVESDDATTERARLEALYGKVWDTAELRDGFEVLSFAAPYVVVRRLVDGKKGSMEFQHHPRYYWGFVE